jgi:hypothetical protein
MFPNTSPMRSEEEEEVASYCFGVNNFISSLKAGAAKSVTRELEPRTV